MCLPQLDNLSWGYTSAGIVLKFVRSSRGLENSTMVKQGQKPGQKTGISIQNTSTLTRGQMKIRVFTGLAGSLQNAHRRKVRNFSFCWMFFFCKDSTSWSVHICSFYFRRRISIAYFICILFGVCVEAKEVHEFVFQAP